MKTKHIPILGLLLVLLSMTATRAATYWDKNGTPWPYNPGFPTLDLGDGHYRLLDDQFSLVTTSEMLNDGSLQMEALGAPTVPGLDTNNYIEPGRMEIGYSLRGNLAAGGRNPAYYVCTCPIHGYHRWDNWTNTVKVCPGSQIHWLQEPGDPRPQNALSIMRRWAAYPPDAAPIILETDIDKHVAAPTNDVDVPTMHISYVMDFLTNNPDLYCENRTNLAWDLFWENVTNNFNGPFVTIPPEATNQLTQVCIVITNSSTTNYYITMPIIIKDPLFPDGGMICPVEIPMPPSWFTNGNGTIIWMPEFNFPVQENTGPTSTNLGGPWWWLHPRTFALMSSPPPISWFTNGAKRLAAKVLTNPPPEGFYLYYGSTNPAAMPTAHIY